MERTLAVIKPDAFAKCKEIEEIIKKTGFKIAARKTIRLTADQARDFYREHQEKSFFNDLVSYMSGGKVRILVLLAPKAIVKWRQTMGPTDASVARRKHPNSIRAQFGRSTERNGVHGSDSFVSAEREILFFFPELRGDSTTDQIRAYLAVEIAPILASGLTELCIAKPDDPVLWLSVWLKQRTRSKTSHQHHELTNGKTDKSTEGSDNNT